MDEAVRIDLVESAGPLALGHIELDLLGEDVWVEGDRHRLRVGKDRLGELELRRQLGDVVDNDAGVAQLGSQLRDHVHAVLRDVLEW